MHDAPPEFREAMRHAGLEPPGTIEPGKLHRFPGVGKCNGNTAGWCKLFNDGLGGCFGDWSSGLSNSWRAKRDRPLTPAEAEAFKRHVTEAKDQAEAARKAKQAETAMQAAAIWESSTPAAEDHPYLRRKGIKPSGARLHDDALVIPLRASGEICSLQFIAPTGEKRFLSGGRVTGCYFSIGNAKRAAALCIAEGFATGATIHEATGNPVAVAFNAGNLRSIAETMRERFPELSIILCADDDHRTEGNPGITKATEAARSVGGMVAIPVFEFNRPEKATDFNDMAELYGSDAVCKVIASARTPVPSDLQSGNEGAPNEAGDDCVWPDLLPLVVKVKSEPYPIDALPDTIRAAVEEVLEFTKAPVPLVASSALAALSLAIQAHADAKRAEKLTGPVGLFLLTIADSGERKSTCDGFFAKAIRDYEEAQAELAKPSQKDFAAAIEAWEAKRSGIKERIRELSKRQKPTADLESALRDLEHEKPEPPRIPRLLYADATPEALAFGLAKGWPSGGVVTAEGGIVFGSHGMGKDSVMRNLSLLNQLWDGSNLTIDRRTSESFTVRGVRLTVALQVQEPTLREFFERSGNLARGTGFLARFLVSWPESTQGFRLFTDPPTIWPALEKFNQRIAEILNTSVPIDDQGALSPTMLTLAPDAKETWSDFHNAIVGELRTGGELYDIRDVASKSADNVARVAALFHCFGSKSSNISGSNVSRENIESACRIVAWHLNESRRFFGELALPAELTRAARLDAYLLDYCRRERTHLVPIKKVQQYGPSGLREKAAIDAAVRELEELGRARPSQEGRRKIIEVNPALLIEDGAS